MKAITTAALALGLLAGSAFAADTKMTLKDDKDKVSYSIGLNIGKSMKQEGLEINPDALAAAMKDVFAGTKPQLTDEEVQAVMQDFQKKMMAKQMAAREEGLSKNKAEGEKFLADNKKKDGVKTTASGLQYKVIKDGTGKTPKATDTVKTHYRGTLINGTEFDSSYKRGEPAEFPVGGVIKGWTEALQLMKEGAKWQLFIPSELAYGERGAGAAFLRQREVTTLRLLILDEWKTNFSRSNTKRRHWNLNFSCLNANQNYWKPILSHKCTNRTNCNPIFSPKKLVQSHRKTNFAREYRNSTKKTSN
ncbi:MAG: FKBP-type peptidyl-prolyl cis-trans isomerase, partial [Verrucomicrobia bacterium]|nr:FKBP-type peptidyl-prolyl cis-trans isomerase [Verrucomicrobiota bacterium]